MSQCIFVPVNACGDLEKVKIVEFLSRGFLNVPPIQPHHIPWYVDDVGDEELKWKYDLQYRLHHLIRFAAEDPDQYFEQHP